MSRCIFRYKVYLRVLDLGMLEERRHPRHATRLFLGQELGGPLPKGEAGEPGRLSMMGNWWMFHCCLRFWDDTKKGDLGDEIWGITDVEFASRIDFASPPPQNAAKHCACILSTSVATVSYGWDFTKGLGSGHYLVVHPTNRKWVSSPQL